MWIKVVYVFRSKQALKDVLKNAGHGDLWICLGPPIGWTSEEPDVDQISEDGLNEVKLTFFRNLLEEYDHLGEYMDCSEPSVAAFDRFWTVERIELEGELHVFDPKPV